MENNNNNIDKNSHAAKLHNEIINYLGHREDVCEEAANKLYELLFSPNLANVDKFIYVHDLELLYQFFDLANDKRKDSVAKEIRHIYSMEAYKLKKMTLEEYKLLLQGSLELQKTTDLDNSSDANHKRFNDFNKKTPEQQHNQKLVHIANLEWKSKRKTPMKEIITQNLNEGIYQNGYDKDKNASVKDVLLACCNRDKADFDEYLDGAITNLVRVHFMNNKKPKNLFYASYEYIKDFMALEEKQGGYFNSFNESHQSIRFVIEEIDLMIQLRVMYPRKEHSRADKERYKFEKQLFDKAFFNRSVLIGGTDTMNPKYLELGSFLNKAIKYLENGGKLKKSVWSALYFIIKEMNEYELQRVFSIKTEESIKYDKAMWKIFDDMLWYTPAIFKDDNDPDFRYNAIGYFKGKYMNPYLETLDKQTKKLIEGLTVVQKKLLKGLFYICMWEKASYKIGTEKDTHPRLLEMYNKMPDDYIKYSRNKLFLTDIHKLFLENDIDNIASVLKEVSKLLGMSKNGFDLAFLNFEKPITNTNDIVKLLYDFSRLEQAAIEHLISAFNLVRERQSKKFPIIKGYNKVDDNYKKMQKIDMGFNIDFLESTLFPLKHLGLHHIVSSIYSTKTVKFICETDRVFKDNKEVDWIATNKKALNTIYAYKIRNQRVHLSPEQNIENLIKMKSPVPLLLLLIGAYGEYATTFNTIAKYLHEHSQDTFEESCGIMTPLHILRHIEKLIQAICIIISVKNENNPGIYDYDIERLRFTNIDKEENYIEKLESYLKSIYDNKDKKLDIDSYKLADDEMPRAIALFEKLYNGSKEHGESFKNYAENIDIIIINLLSFLFSSEVQDYNSSTYFDSFLNTYHTESSFYILYLSQFFLDGFDGYKSL